MMILVCIMIFAFLVTVAFAVDIAYMHLVKSELRAATDAASKAASEALARTQNANQAIARGKEIGAENLVAGKGLQLSDSDFTFGRSTPDGTGRFLFQVGGSPINSVRVEGKRTNGSLSGNVGLFFGKIFGVQNFQPSEVCTSTFIQRDIVLVVDRSGSMLDFNKFVDLRAAVAIFIQILIDSPIEESVGLASYSSLSSEDVNLTTNLNVITSTINRMAPSGATNISGGIDSGAAIMDRGRSRQFIDRTMIVLTDGIQNVGRPARDAALTEAAKGTVIHTITFGRDADKTAMAEVARVGKGRFFHADNGTQLKQVFTEIALTLTTIITE